MKPDIRTLSAAFILLSSILICFSFQTIRAQTADPDRLDGFSIDRVSAQIDLERELIGQLTPEVYREHLFNLTQEPHIAGTQESRRVIEYLSESMESAGLRVEHYDYDVWLPEPGEIRVELVRPKRLPLNNREYILDEDPYSSDDRLHHGWNAYSGSGNVTGQVVYANYGRKQDFEKLEEMGVSIKGKVVIARYGGNFRGYKAKYAEKFGASGLIIYSDPENGGYVSGPAYPEDKFITESTIQRGSALTLDFYGDPLTPFEPALPLGSDADVERLDPADVDFHTIPIAPLPYASAEKILEQMDGTPVPSRDWQGGLPFTYRVTSDTPVEVNVNVEQPADFKEITNVVGFIEGSEYPDEWIILGSHHDAWGFGTIDPNSGTAMLLTLADGLGELLKSGKRPKRSILIAHWDAEEYMLIGSSEWVEQLTEELDAKSVLYLNADSAVTGPAFRASSSPSLKKPIIDASRMVQHPDTSISLYESWMGEADTPNIGNLGGGSDHVGLYMHIGTPSAGISMSQGAPVYHSNYDTFHYYETQLDSTFAYGPALGGVYGTVSLRFANSDLLPFDLARYTEDLSTHLEEIQQKADDQGVSLDTGDLQSQIEEIQTVAKSVVENIDSLTRNGFDGADKDRINRALLRLERIFIFEDGMPYSPWLKSLYASPDPYSGYASWMLPAFQYAIEEKFTEDQVTRWVGIHRDTFEKLHRSLEEVRKLTESP